MASTIKTIVTASPWSFSSQYVQGRTTTRSAIAANMITLEDLLSLRLGALTDS